MRKPKPARLFPTYFSRVLDTYPAQGWVIQDHGRKVAIRDLEATVQSEVFWLVNSKPATIYTVMYSCMSDAGTKGVSAWTRFNSDPLVYMLPTIEGVGCMHMPAEVVFKCVPPAWVFLPPLLSKTERNALELSKSSTDLSSEHLATDQTTDSDTP